MRCDERSPSSQLSLYRFLIRPLISAYVAECMYRRIRMPKIHLFEQSDLCCLAGSLSKRGKMFGRVRAIAGSTVCTIIGKGPVAMQAAEAIQPDSRQWPQGSAELWCRCRCSPGCSRAHRLFKCSHGQRPTYVVLTRQGQRCPLPEVNQ